VLLFNGNASSRSRLGYAICCRGDDLSLFRPFFAEKGMACYKGLSYTRQSMVGINFIFGEYHDDR